MPEVPLGIGFATNQRSDAGAHLCPSPLGAPDPIVVYQISRISVNRKWIQIAHFDKSRYLPSGLVTKTPVDPAKAEDPAVKV